MYPPSPWVFRGTVRPPLPIPQKRLVLPGRCVEGLYRVTSQGRSPVLVNGVLLNPGDTLDLSGAVTLTAVPRRDVNGNVLPTRYDAQGVLHLLTVCCCGGCGQPAPNGAPEALG
jgi:hypothetical protein